MQLHVFRARDQPATRFVVTAGDHRHWVRNPPRRLLHTSCCKKWRIAMNLVAQVYYDGTYLFCRKGTGCKR